MNANHEKRESPIFLAALAVFLLMLGYTFALPLIPLVSLGWHYLLCALLLGLCWQAKKKGMRRLCLVICGLIQLVAVVGFVVVYLGPFVESGKTFFQYVTFYAPCTLPVFLFPVAGAAISLKAN